LENLVDLLAAVRRPHRGLLCPVSAKCLITPKADLP
jgi:hypothetical protein